MTEGVIAAGIVPGSDFVANVESRTPLKGIGKTQDIGELATFLASDAASWITGEIVRVAGGA